MEFNFLLFRIFRCSFHSLIFILSTNAHALQLSAVPPQLTKIDENLISLLSWLPVSFHYASSCYAMCIIWQSCAVYSYMVKVNLINCPFNNTNEPNQMGILTQSIFIYLSCRLILQKKNEILFM